MARCACLQRGKYQCPREAAPGYTICDKHRNRCRRNWSWRDTQKGTAWKLRFSRGYTREEADQLAERLHDDDQRCAICGVSRKDIRRLSSLLGDKVRGGMRYNRRLTVDRIDPKVPHSLANTRILCFSCNAYRRDNKANDERILIWQRRQWQSLVIRRLLTPQDLTFLR